ncbi:putative Exonuclease 1 [Glarea lozoyensis 74030]|uniref:Putative Exonuclease 1 n=1 Tax=Glarea lozoyensis (strain ATCC 74030 / MF5533) TaxID=1104152 RepID=H0EL24_GLAL7|nr:putative Exonuclease 1 [Glarea lozoyensis 74030]
MSVPVNLKKFEGKTLGIDAYGWLHRGTVACAMEIAKGQPTRKFVDFCMHRVRMLQHFGVVPFLVFDGDYLPSKAATESERSKRREESKRSGYELESAGKLQQAYAEFQKAVDVTPEMARQLIDELKITGVQYLVAPYEADAQMQPIIVRLPSKTQTSISTPFSSRPQYRTSVSSADLKKGVSIEEFFKPRRTPLAELDPNCFTPSPNQQDALRRNSGPWNGSPAPRQYINRAMTEPDLPQSAPPERLPTARHARAPTISEPRPPKRARLCADEDVLFPNRNVQLGPSKFFKSEYPDPSPTAGRAKSRKSRKMDITVFSDDSIEEVMLNLPELVSSKAGGVQKMSIFEDAKLNESDTNLLPGPRDCAEVITIHKTDDVQDKVPSLTASTSATSSFEQPATPTATPSSASLNLLEWVNIKKGSVFGVSYYCLEE